MKKVLLSGVATLSVLEMMRGYVAAFHRGLADAGFSEGRNVAIEYRWAEGHNDRLPALATDLVHREVTIIVVGGSTPGALAAKSVTDTIPVVFLVGTDPVKVGLVASLARPGGNITGITILNVELLAKGLEFAHNLMPPGATIAVLLNPSNLLQAATERGIIQSATRVLGARLLALDASSPGEIESAFGTLVSERAGALVVSGEVFFLTQRARLIELAAVPVAKDPAPARTSRRLIAASHLQLLNIRSCAEVYRKRATQCPKWGQNRSLQ